ncbi:hypothetical protein K3495_g4355 [Podosphaera aphanis]|nr:hypothetical protein K3495_g4355 [Podosphaera aphanis]
MDSVVCLKSSSSPEAHPSRPRSNPNLSLEKQFEASNDQKISSLNQQNRTSQSISELENNISLSQSFTSAQTPSYLNSFTLLPETDSTSSWSYLTSNDEQLESTSLLALGSTPPFLENSSKQTDPISICSNTYAANMSTTGTQDYDSQFNSYHTWPRYDFHDQFFASLPSSEFFYEEPELLPSSMCSRSPSSSPPHARLSVEQRELRRQQDQARRESKTCMRRARSGSSNRKKYCLSQRTSPDLLPKQEYANSVTPSPFLSQSSIETSPALSSGPFLPSYSPQIPSDIYGQAFVSPNDFTSTMVYPLPYTNQPETTIPSYLQRSQSFNLASMPDHVGVYCPPPISSRGSASESSEPVRVVHSRPKPQCWEHGCNGRQFSTFSNLLRHQREKSGAAQKSSCPHCGAEFTRTTARNGHLAHDKCKQRRSS